MVIKKKKISFFVTRHSSPGTRKLQKCLKTLEKFWNLKKDENWRETKIRRFHFLLLHINRLLMQEIDVRTESLICDWMFRYKGMQ